jgi:hypothetical protein
MVIFRANCIEKIKKIKKISVFTEIFDIQMVGMPGLEPGTIALKGRCSTNWATFPYFFV